MNRDAVWELCKSIAPIYDFDPLLILAVSEQESVDGHDPTIYHEDAARLEEGFYLQYTKPMNLCTTNEVLLATSYGLTQMMGECLREVGYFDWWFSKQPPITQQFLVTPLSELAVPKAINEYMVHPEWQIEYGCKLMVNKRALSHGSDTTMLRIWNGDVSGTRHYAENVFGRRAKLMAIYRP